MERFELQKPADARPLHERTVTSQVVSDDAELNTCSSRGQIAATGHTSPCFRGRETSSAEITEFWLSRCQTHFSPTLTRQAGSRRWQHHRANCSCNQQKKMQSNTSGCGATKAANAPQPFMKRAHKHAAAHKLFAHTRSRYPQINVRLVLRSDSTNVTDS